MWTARDTVNRIVLAGATTVRIGILFTTGPVHKDILTMIARGGVNRFPLGANELNFSVAKASTASVLYTIQTVRNRKAPSVFTHKVWYMFCGEMNAIANL